MNFNTHKINGVEKSVCTAEQMIAYNFSQTYKEMSGDWIACVARKHMEDENPKSFAKYNQDIILHLIASCKGKTYFGKIASSYEEVGRFFPLNALK